MGFRQVDPTITSESTETFRLCRVFCADHFGNRLFQARTYFYKNTGQILFRLFLQFLQEMKSIFSKNR